MDLIQVGRVGKQPAGEYYSITPAGRKQIVAEEDNWRQISEILTRFLEPSGGSL